MLYLETMHAYIIYLFGKWLDTVFLATTDPRQALDEIAAEYPAGIVVLPATY